MATNKTKSFLTQQIECSTYHGDILPKDTEIEINVLKHNLVPEHIILDEKERKELLDKLGIKPEQLPKILKNDGVVKQIDAKEGDIIKITRISSVAGRIPYYRIVSKKMQIL